MRAQRRGRTQVSPFTSRTHQTMFSIWLDTDIGGDVDDAACLLCAIRHPDVQLVGVSTVMHRVEINSWIAREMLRRAGLGDVPVLSGAAIRLGGDAAAEDASDWIPSHGRLAPPLPRLSAHDDSARVAAIANAMLSVNEPYHLLTIGPMTNAARLLRDHPQVRKRWSSVTCMGGWLDAAKAEYNVEADVTAAQAVVAHTAPTMVGLEASSYTLPREEVEAALDPTDPVSAFLLDCYREYRDHSDWLDPDGGKPMTLYDAIALISMVRPDLFTLQQVKVLIENDGRMRLTDDGSPLTYATACNWDGVKSVILGLLRGARR
ncbi:MAG: nucleoside hydrolase [Armatimonadota bacterium]